MFKQPKCNSDELALYLFDPAHFELKFGQVYFPNEKNPIASVLNPRGTGVRDLAVDSKGHRAAYSERANDQLYLIDGAKRNKKAIYSGWAHDLKWLEVEAKSQLGKEFLSRQPSAARPLTGRFHLT
jgi:hypothetical protein